MRRIFRVLVNLGTTLVPLFFRLSGEGEDGDDGEKEAGQVPAGEAESIGFSNAIVRPVCRILAKRLNGTLLSGGLKDHEQMPQHTILLSSYVAGRLEARYPVVSLCWHLEGRIAISGEDRFVDFVDAGATANEKLRLLSPVALASG
jgi:hypothetical protein